jgi:RNA polymerase sigma-70 factor, ECF subfamily
VLRNADQSPAFLGDEEFLALLGKHRHEFYRYVLRTVWDSGVADDVFSAGVLAAYEHKTKFRPGTNFRAWMFRILTNKCFVANRETMRAFEPLDAHANFVALDEDLAYGDVLRDPDGFLEHCGDEVNRSFRKLSTAQRSCILLRDVERFSYQEIAEILEMPMGTVMTNLARGRAKLRSELVEYARSRGIVRAFPRIAPRERGTPRDGEETDSL